MGLTTWKNSPEGRILKSDVMIAKNCLEKNIVDDEYVYIRKNAFYNHIKDTKESQKFKNATFPEKLEKNM